MVSKKNDKRRKGQKERKVLHCKGRNHILSSTFFFSHYHVFFLELLSGLKVQKLSLCVPTMFVLLFIVFCTFFLPWTGHRIVANGSVCSGFNVIDFHIA